MKRRSLRTVCIFVPFALILLASTIVGGAANDCVVAAAGFERSSTSALQITATFLTKPKIDEGAREFAKHIAHSRVLGRSYTTKLNRASSGKCLFLAGTNGLDLHFYLSNTSKVIHNECSLADCASLLSNLIRSAEIDQGEFAATIEAIKGGIQIYDSADFKYPLLAALRATREAYRHIYRAGTVEWSFAEITGDDFDKIDFEDFTNWAKSQRGGFAAPEPSAQRQSSEASGAGHSSCSPKAEIAVRDVWIDHHGWGHSSIIMIKNAYTKDGRAGIDNEQLREFCAGGGREARSESFDTPVWREMVGRILCFRQQFNRDKWLVLYGHKAPERFSDMKRYAQQIADALSADKCVRDDIQVIAVEFSRQR